MSLIVSSLRFLLPEFCEFCKYEGYIESELMRLSCNSIDETV